MFTPQLMTREQILIFLSSGIVGGSPTRVGIIISVRKVQYEPIRNHHQLHQDHRPRLGIGLKVSWGSSNVKKHLCKHVLLMSHCNIISREGGWGHNLENSEIDSWQVPRSTSIRVVPSGSHELEMYARTLKTTKIDKVVCHSWTL